MRSFIIIPKRSPLMLKLFPSRLRLSSIPVLLYHLHLGDADFPFPAPLLLLLLLISSLNCCLLTSVKKQPCVQPSDSRTRSGLTHTEPKQILPQCSVKQTHLRESSNVNISKGGKKVIKRKHDLCKEQKDRLFRLFVREKKSANTFCSQTFAVICLLSGWLPIMQSSSAFYPSIRWIVSTQSQRTNAPETAPVRMMVLSSPWCGIPLLSSHPTIPPSMSIRNSIPPPSTPDSRLRQCHAVNIVEKKHISVNYNNQVNMIWL